jgi:hypothetical protein
LPLVAIFVGGMELPWNFEEILIIYLGVIALFFIKFSKF